jgi:hypothetical protein
LPKIVKTSAGRRLFILTILPFYKAWRNAIHSRNIRAEDYRLQKASGDITGTGRAEPVRDPDRVSPGGTGRRRAFAPAKLLERALAPNLNNTLEESLSVLFILDSRGDFDFVNHQAASMFVLIRTRGLSRV